MCFTLGVLVLPLMFLQLAVKIAEVSLRILDIHVSMYHSNESKFLPTLNVGR
jgi:hypothetical protein